MKIQRRIVVITGGGGAIGSALAAGFAAGGDRVVIGDLPASTGPTVAQGIADSGGEAVFYPLDLLAPSAVPAFFRQVNKDLGPVDVLVNNAGINLAPEDRFPFRRQMEDRYGQIMAVDLHGLVACSRQVLPSMARRRRGKVLNISSIAGVATLRNQSAFVGAKAAVIALTRSLAVDYGPAGIQVNAIAPGSIAFPGTRRLLYGDPDTAARMLSHIPAGRPGDPEDIVRAALLLCHRDQTYINGHTLVVDGGWTAGFTRAFA